MILSLLIPAILSFLLATPRSITNIERAILALLACIVMLSMAFYWTHLMRTYPAHYRTWISSSYEREGIAVAVVALCWISLEALLAWRKPANKVSHQP